MRNKVNCNFCNADIERIPTKSGTHFCNNECKGKWQQAEREKLGYTKDWLVYQYFTLNKSCNVIAKEIGRDPKRVWEWFKQYGINVKERGHNWADNLIADGSTWIGRKHKEKTKEKIKAARLRDGHVPYLKNGEHWLKGVGKESHPSYKGGLTPERQAFYASELWADAIKAVWKRDNATCQRCGKHHNTATSRGTFHIHHIVSFQVRELRSDVNNLILLCKECHRWVHSKQNANKDFIK